MSYCNVKYKISCHGCNTKYLDLTKRLRTKISEYRADVNKKSKLLSMIFIHRLNFNHEFDWDHMKSLIKTLVQEILSEM